MSAGIVSWKLICAMIFLLITVSDFGSGQDDDDFKPHYCLNTGTYTTNSTYSANLNAALSALSSNMTQYGFYNASVGQGQDRANAVALCRSDVLLEPCRRCVENATGQLVQLCPNSRQAIRWYDLCMLHYSNMPITGTQNNLDTGLGNNQDVSDAAQFREDRDALLDALRAKAVNGSSLLKAGAGSRNTSDYLTIYAILQCIPYTSQEECDKCLIRASHGMPIAASWARRLLASCTLDYNTKSFYNETRLRELDVLLPQIPISPPGYGDDNTRGKKDGNSTKTVIIIVVPIAVCLILVVCAVIFLRKRMKRTVLEATESGDIAVDEINTVDSLQYDFRVISKATDGFADANRMGQGGFGTVYRGKLSNGEEIAVKMLSKGGGQGDKEFKNEVLILAGLQHRNLIKLLGFSMERRERLLIYEFAPNASLDKFIFDPIKSSQLDWQKRRRIIGGIARGLLYLHEDSRLRIIHRDLKPSNILLNEVMDPKIADFGMARLFESNETQGDTNRVVGTYGYMPPEYALYGQFSVKSDVFSFGVLVLETISGQKSVTNSGETMEDLLSIAWKNWREGTAENVIDPVLLRSGRECVREMVRCIHIGLLCVQENAANRPLMNSVVLMLSSFTITLPVASQPAFVVSSQEYDSRESNSKATTDISQNEMSVTELHPR